MRNGTGSGSTAMAQSFICVSGFDPIPATTLTLPNSLGEVAVTALADLTGYLKRVDLIPHLPRRGRCHDMSCRRWVHPRELEDGRLGITGYCAACLTRLIRQCKRAVGRLPGPGEFFCPFCLTVRQDATDRCPVEADGRVRNRCKPCRVVQLRARVDKRSLRRGIRLARED